MEAKTIVGAVADELKGGAERWAPVIGIRTTSAGGIETARAERLAPMATKREALDDLAEAMAAVDLVEDWCKAIRAECERAAVIAPAAVSATAVLVGGRHV